MTSDLERLVRDVRNVSPRPIPHHRDVLLHSHPRFVDMMHGFSAEFSTVSPDCVYSFDLNRLPLPADPSSGADPCLHEAVLTIQISRADRIFLGIDAGGKLPPLWKTVLRSLLKSRPLRKGALVLLEDTHPDPESVAFLEDLAARAGLGFIQWKPEAAHAG